MVVFIGIVTVNVKKGLGVEPLVMVNKLSDYLNLLTGLTAWAQVNGRDELPIPQKVALDIEYLNRQSFGFDLYIIWLTFIKVIRKDGVSH
jgi:O-antigen biosynthesis protein WbqP